VATNPPFWWSVGAARAQHASAMRLRPGHGAVSRRNAFLFRYPPHPLIARYHRHLVNRRSVSPRWLVSWGGVGVAYRVGLHACVDPLVLVVAATVAGSLALLHACLSGGLFISSLAGPEAAGAPGRSPAFLRRSFCQPDRDHAAAARGGSGPPSACSRNCAASIFVPARGKCDAGAYVPRRFAPPRDKVFTDARSTAPYAAGGDRYADSDNAFAYRKWRCSRTAREWPRPSGPFPDRSDATERLAAAGRCGRHQVSGLFALPGSSSSQPDRGIYPRSLLSPALPPPAARGSAR